MALEHTKLAIIGLGCVGLPVEVDAELEACDEYVVTVPTPMGSAKRPDLTPRMRASETVAANLRAPRLDPERREVRAAARSASRQARRPAT